MEKSSGQFTSPSLRRSLCTPCAYGFKNGTPNDTKTVGHCPKGFSVQKNMYSKTLEDHHVVDPLMWRETVVNLREKVAQPLFNGNGK